jgi:phosphoribosylaminoimidazole (AIR) synthetase
MISSATVQSLSFLDYLACGKLDAEDFRRFILQPTLWGMEAEGMAR